jgi:GR25 family glycosyltransferase involved in LPS biosynthesis
MKYYAIHVVGQETRKKNLQELSNILGEPIELQTSDMPKEILERTKNCTSNHVEALKKFLNTDEPEAVIFEDDCVIKDYEGFRNFYLDAPANYDILYFGVKAYVNFGKTDGNYIKTTRSWGCHAYLVTRWAATCIINQYNCIVANNPPAKILSLPPDWLINYSILDFELNAYGPTFPWAYCQQANIPSLVSPKNFLVSYYNGGGQDGRAVTGGFTEIRRLDVLPST